MNTGDDDDLDTTESPVLRDNMAELRKRDSRGVVALAQAIGGIGTGSVNRAIRGEGGSQLRTLVKIAEYFGVEPWQLLAPDLGRHLDWPFPHTDRRRYLRLGAVQRGIVEGRLQAALSDADDSANDAQG